MKRAAPRQRAAHPPSPLWAPAPPPRRIPSLRPAHSGTTMPSLLITGANRGLGLELARQYAAAGWRVFATCRPPAAAADLQALARPNLLSIHPLDVKDHAQIDRLAAELAHQPLDLLLNNAGIYGPKKMLLGQVDYAAWAEVFAVNTLAPLRLVE